ncbi:MAG: hypothetical protein HOB40_04600 [Candidatus Marinimicrobia bacterium]|nr:hypothetical protein [Candidatus Neomarinimicrobiota bacterium]MBT3999806.1 hypothetical protein [Candidatus Neomarinimicrobiota bacterium]MBT4281861.1 hypothetical protein [Candidatus Neomarinimicrobiota bacterium]MBT4578675.1 hypothetical protein [Candidatus Neomarinimicrobiota bacterium]MBT4957082.1 hypothetical protein [Candidatus Neomarinimicrobiota bacterium]
MKLTYTSPDQLFWFILLIGLLGLIFSFYQVRKNIKLRPILMLRSFLLLLLVLLLLDPNIEQSKSKSIDLDWHIYIDRSLSMSYHSHPSVGSFISGIDMLIDRINEKNVNLKVIGFGSNLDTTWALGDKKIAEGSTDLGQVISHIQSSDIEGLGGSIIITDGQANLGSEIPSQSIGISSPIHIVGVGDETPLIDVAIHSIDAPPVIIKGENADFDVTISSHGTINERLNVTIYSGTKLVGSKVVTVSGDGSLERVRFRINPNHTGEIKYKVQVNVLSDENNIFNNKQIVPIQVLKNDYAIAFFTGAPNFNTHIIKQILTDNPNYQIDHYVYRPDGYSKPLKSFWDTKYDLIIFDNNPIKENASEWKSYLRILAKKLIAQQTSIAFVVGHDTDKSSLKTFLSLVDVSLNDPLIQLETTYDWNLNSNWDSFFPFHKINRMDVERSNLPPLFAQIELDSSNAISLANFSLSEFDFPLFLIGEKSPLRFMVWASPDLNTLYYKTRDTKLSNLINEMFDPVFSWLMRTGNDRDFYFRSDKNSYQQGERVTVSGKPIRDTQVADEGFLHISQQGERINTKPIRFNEKTGNYTSQFWASQFGQLDYEIELLYGENSILVGEGAIQVQESQIELNHVYLNKGPLFTLAYENNGTFNQWDDRHLLVNNISLKSKNEIFYSKVILHNNWIFFVFILGILSAEWLLRRRLGLM